MKRLETSAVFIIIFAIYLTASLILVLKIGYVSQEVNVRSGIAYDLLDGNERGREGLVCSVWWAPIPTLLQLTFGAFPSLISSGVACGIISAAGGALMCFFLFKAFIYLGIKRAAAYPMLILLAFNPWMFFYSSNGSSEALLLGILAGTVWCLLLWYHDNRLSGLIGLSILAALLPLIKHQALLLTFVILASAVVISAIRRKPRLSTAEGTFCLAFSPTIYTVGLWFLFNWLIMGDFLYFLRGVYIDPVRPETTYELTRAHTMLASLLTSRAAENAVPFLVQFLVVPFLPAAVILMLVSFVRQRRTFLASLLLLLAAMPLYHIFMISRGQSFGITKDALVVIPMSAFLAGYFLSTMFKRKELALNIASTCVVAVMLAGTIASYAFIARGKIDMTPDENKQGKADIPIPFAAVDELSLEEMAIKDFIRAKEIDSKIALIGFQGYDFIRRAKGGGEFIHSINLNLPLILKNTRGKTLYILVPRPAGLAAFDDINIELPNLYHLGETTIGSPGLKAHFMIENKDFQNWRVYTIVRPESDETIFGTAHRQGMGS